MRQLTFDDWCDDYPDSYSDWLDRTKPETVPCECGRELYVVKRIPASLHNPEEIVTSPCECEDLDNDINF